MDTPEKPTRSQLDVVNTLNNASSRAITISSVIYVLIAVALVIAAAVFIVDRFDSRGVAVAVAVIGGSLGVFALTLIGRFISAEITKALHAAEQAKKERDKG